MGTRFSRLGVLALLHEHELRFAMKLGGDYRVYPHRSTWTAVARDLGVDPTDALDRLLALTDRAPAAFAEAAAADEVVALERPLPEHLVNLVSERAERCEAIL